MSRRVAVVLATSATVVVAGGVAVAVGRGGGTPGQRVEVAPLSASEIAALDTDRELVGALQQSFTEVPQAAADLAGISPAKALRELSSVPTLQPLVDAIGGQSASVTRLVVAYRAATTAAEPDDVASVPAALDALQSIEGDLLPALRLVALRHGLHVSAAAALEAVERDAATPELGRLLANWSAVYGAFLLLEQQALSSTG